jgi:hypothetical protein
MIRARDTRDHHRPCARVCNCHLRTHLLLQALVEPALIVATEALTPAVLLLKTGTVALTFVAVGGFGRVVAASGLTGLRDPSYRSVAWLPSALSSRTSHSERASS